jgi:hypothetical protein
MKIVYTEQALVRVWRNVKVLGKVPTSHFGHAAVTVSGLGVKTTDADEPHMQHISFWPGNGGASIRTAFKDAPGSFSDGSMGDRVSEMNKLTAIRLEVGYCKANGIGYPPEWDQALLEANKPPLPKPRQGQKQLLDPTTNMAVTNPQYTYRLTNGTEVLVPMYSQSPQAKFFLPGLRAKGAHWGLNTTRMADWWIGFQQKNPQYRAFSAENNCVGIALQGLAEGGATAIAKPPAVRFYGEPVQVETYARELEQQFLHLEGLTRLLEVSIKSNRLAQKAVSPDQLGDGIWTLDQWKKASALGIMYQRSGTIQEIDHHLNTFQRLTWKYAFQERYDAFVKLFLTVVKHREEKQDSKRSEAIAQLGSQILDVLAGGRFYDGYRPMAA